MLIRCLFQLPLHENTAAPVILCPGYFVVRSFSLG
jgi:hypothetical protein